MRALHTAATGMMAQEMNVQVISNNVANMRTTGFKRQRVNFQDLLYEQYRRAGTPTSDQGNQIPAGVFVGSGVKTVSTPRVMTQGNLSPTEKTYDMAIRGEGFFRVQLADGRIGFTRDGALELDSQGRLTTPEGMLIDPGITIPQNATSVSINAQGVISALTPGNAQPQQVGQLTLSRFVNKTGLESIGDNIFLETAGSGAPVDGAPASEGFGSIQQGFVEEANVNAVTEISSLIAAQRAYELNAKVITASDQMLNAAAQIFRG
ncbi:MAG: flagellar basal-body rod protein FlgG [Beijerinckiaceae bacterium]